MHYAMKTITHTTETFQIENDNVYSYNNKIV